MKFLKNIRQKNLIALLPVLFTIGFISFAYIQDKTMKKVMVNGETYLLLEEQKNFSNDMVIPSLNLIQTYMNLMQAQAAMDKTARDAALDDYSMAASGVRDSRAHWEKISDSKKFKDTYMGSQKTADDFINIAEAEVVPALKRGDKATAIRIIDQKLDPLYRKHESQIDDTIVEVAKENATLKNDVTASVAASRKKTITLGGGILLVIIILSFIIRRMAIKQQELNDDYAAQVAAIGKSQAVIEFGIDGTVRTANHNFLETMGYTLDEIVGQHHRLFVEAEYAQSQDYQEFWDCLRRGEFVMKEFKRIGKDGKVVWIQASYNPIFDARGNITKVVKYATDITPQVNLRSQMEEVLGGVARNAKALSAASSELSAVSQQMTANAEETSAQASTASAAAEQVSRNVQTVAAGTEEMSASIREIARNAAEAARVARSAVGIAETTNNTVSKLGESSNEIGNVIKVITSIAQQTKLLALNATIEAARAGEAGKGFAVVANEVKELAKETAKATEDISLKIEAIQSDTRGAVTAIGQISSIIDQINDIQTTIAGSVEEQTATTNEMGRNVAESAVGTNEIANNITGVAQAAQDTSAGASKALAAAQSLTEMASDLEALVSKMDL